MWSSNSWYEGEGEGEADGLSGRHTPSSALALPRRCRSRSLMPWPEEDMRRAGALVALAAASALVLMLFPAPATVENRYADLVLALFAALLLDCAAVLLSPARRAVARLARRGVEAAGGPRWFGFAGVVFYAAYVVGAAWKQPPAPAAVSVDKVNGFLFFLIFLAGVWTVNMSVLTGKGSRPAAAEGELGGWEVDTVLP